VEFFGCAITAFSDRYTYLVGIQYLHFQCRRVYL